LAWSLPWVPLGTDLRTIDTAANQATAAAALDAFAATWEDRYRAVVKLRRAHWAEFIPFLAFPPEVRRLIYTTDDRERERPAAAGSRNRGQFPSGQVARKVLYWQSATWRNSAARTPGSAALGGNKRSRRSRSTSTVESQPHGHRMRECLAIGFLRVQRSR
jgi:transposase-like protein